MSLSALWWGTGQQLASNCSLISRLVGDWRSAGCLLGRQLPYPFLGPGPQAQLSQVQAQARDTQRVLTEQLQAVQDERNTCLAAANRADQLLVRLGQRALISPSVDWHPI